MVMFRGGGLALAKPLVKKDPDTFEMQTSTVAGTEDSPAAGSPFRPSMASRVLVAGRGGNAAACYRRVLARLQEIVGGANLRMRIPFMCPR